MRKLRMVAKTAVVCAIASVAGGCSLVGNPLSDKIHVTADFENIAGMYEGNDVAVLGLNIGKIDKIEPKGTYVTVSMTLDGSTKLPPDVMAASISPSLVTNRHIELFPSYTSGPTLEDGAHLPCGAPCGQDGPTRTRTPVELDRVLKTVDEIAQSLKNNGNPEGPLSGGLLVQTLAGNGDKIRESIAALASSLQLGVTNRDAVSQIVIRLNEITQIIAENDQTVRDFSNQTTQLTSLLAEQAPGLRAVLTQINDFLANTSTVLAEHRDKLGPMLSRLTDTTQQLQRNARNLTEIVDLAPLVMQNIDNTVNRQDRYVRLGVLTDKTLLDGELVSLFCERIQMKSDGCRTGRLADFGPDMGLTAQLLGLSGMNP